MDLSIIIVNWNTKSLLRKCLISINKRTKGIDFEIIVVDNASSDGSLKMLKNEFPQCNIVPSKINLGFSKANNLAIKYAKGKYILFLNPDTELKTNALKGMVNFLDQNSRYGAVGCRLLNHDGSTQFSCARKFLTPFRHFCFLALLDRFFPRSKLFSTTDMKYWDHLNSQNVECLSGACITVRKKIIDQLGGFNENYFMYGEDIELCYKIMKAGWLIYYLANEEIFHFAGASSSQRRDKFSSVIIAQESNYKFIKDNYGILQAMAFRFFVFWGSIIRIGVLVSSFPILSILKRYQKEISIYSLKKYLNIFLWAIKIKANPYGTQ